MSAYKASTSARPATMAEHELQESETAALMSALPMAEEHEMQTFETAETEAPMTALPPRASAMAEEHELQEFETTETDDPSALDFPSAEDLQLVYLPKVDDPLGDNARVWRIYRLEKTKQEGLTTDGWNKSLDAVLTFAGLFSAAITSFLVDSYKRIQPGADDYAPSESNKDLNSKWFFSLAITLAAALLCLVAKSWIREYELLLLDAAGSPGSWVDRQVRYRRNMDLCATPLFTTILPYIFHVSLFTFLSGLSELAGELVPGSKHGVDWITNILGAFYFTQLCLPIFLEYCPWRTPFAVVTRLMWMRIWLGRWEILTATGRESTAYALLWLVSQPSSSCRAFATQAIASIKDDADGKSVKFALRYLVIRDPDVLNVLRFREAELRAVKPGPLHVTSSTTPAAAWAPVPSAAVYARARVELQYCSRALELLEGGTGNKTPGPGFVGLRALLKRWIGRARTATSRNNAAQSVGGHMA